jgi:hypothetical protein
LLRETAFDRHGVTIWAAVQAASRPLPVRPNLEHLRKQAKLLLASRRQQDSSAKLADALHAIAREYGFTTWPQLKSHVEALSPLNETGPAVDPRKSFVGAWEADLSQSARPPLNAFQSAVLRFAIDGDTVRIDDVVVDESGRTDRNTNTLHADGRERAVPGGYTVVAAWRDTRTLEAVVSKDGRMEGRVTYALAMDAKTVTLTTGEYVGVFRRRPENEDGG